MLRPSLAKLEGGLQIGRLRILIDERLLDRDFSRLEFFNNLDQTLVDLPEPLTGIITARRDMPVRHAQRIPALYLNDAVTRAV